MEFTVDTGESHIRHLIEFFQLHHHPVADFTAGNFAVKIPLQTLTYIVDQAVYIFGVDRAFVAGVFDTFAQFVGIKIFAFAVAFYYLKLALDNAFVGAETVRTRQTLPAAAHAEPFPDTPGINNFIIKKTALWTTHCQPP